MNDFDPFRLFSDEELASLIQAAPFLLVFYGVPFLIFGIVHVLSLARMPGFSMGTWQLYLVMGLIGVVLMLHIGRSLLWTLDEKLIDRAAAIEQSRLAPIDAFAKQIGLERDEEPFSGVQRLVGWQEDVWLSVSLNPDGTTITATHTVALPQGFRVVRRMGRGAGPSLSNPILDATLHVVEGDRWPAAWTCADLTAALMSVVHQHPGSSVDHRLITLTTPDTLQAGTEGVVRCIDEVLALVSAMRQVDPPILTTTSQVVASQQKRKSQSWKPFV